VSLPILSDRLACLICVRWRIHFAGRADVRLSQNGLHPLERRAGAQHILGQQVPEHATALLVCGLANPLRFSMRAMRFTICQADEGVNAWPSPRWCEMNNASTTPQMGGLRILPFTAVASNSG